jgi:hypothetical protein
MPDGRSRITPDLLSRVAPQVSANAANLIRKRASSGLIGGPVSGSRRRRCELLNLSTDEDMIRWQVIHNDSDRYQVVEEKLSTVGSKDGVEYRCILTYDEIGEDLPLVKSRLELREDDRVRIQNSEGKTGEPDDPYGD